MKGASKSVIDGKLSIRGVLELYDFPFSTVHGKVKNK
jgi:hypothetical protein